MRCDRRASWCLPCQWYLRFRLRRGGEKKWEGWEEGGRDKGWEEQKAERKMEGCTFIYCTHSMTDLHTIVVNSFVF